MARRLLAGHFLSHLRLHAQFPVPPPLRAPAITRCGGLPSPPIRAPQASSQYKLEKEIKKMKRQAKENANLIDADDSDELRSICPEDDMTLWSGSEDDDDDDVPTEAHPNERSDSYIDKVFEFDETPKYRTISELLNAEEPPEQSPGKQARKLAVENALKKLKKEPDGRNINVFDVVTDIDIPIGAFENVISGPEYSELAEGGPKKLNIQFFKNIQARMRDPNFKFSPELKLKPKSKLVSRKKWQKAQARKRKNDTSPQRSDGM
ncbi:uncharacterized protein LOC133910314 [Phragmites australis]|uniref:uncharacterized protein LOC133910314 n=1 Tax=Phragmites australis TaxID=29695 RepID=UPI002D79721A|nr:uncharacterized protein LOC133910314 [Phragmites australis]